MKNSQATLIVAGSALLIAVVAALAFWGGGGPGGGNGTPISTTTPGNGGTMQEQRQVSLHFFNESKDKDASGNIMCSRAGLDPVTRNIPATSTTPIQDTINLLLQGGIAPQERARGITTEFPLPGVRLTGADLKNGVLTLSFEDPENWTGGGSCRVGILWFQIEATVKQFAGVETVRFLPEELFQP